MPPWSGSAPRIIMSIERRSVPGRASTRAERGSVVEEAGDRTTHAGWTMRRTIRLACSSVVGAALLAPTGPAAAQLFDRPPRGTTVVLRAGGYLPGGDLYPGHVHTDVLPPRLALGVGVENSAGDLPLAVRLTLDVVPRYTVRPRLACPDDLAGSCPERGSRTNRLAMGAVDLVARPVRLGTAAPFLLVGVGVKALVREGIAQDLAEPELHFGVGTEFEIAGRRLALEVADHMSWIVLFRGLPSQLQHDLVVAVGLPLAL